ncbi:MAG: IS110 family transposase [Acidimicrobiales bacterium]
MDVIVDRCAGLDVHKRTVMATIRTPDRARGRAQQTREFATFTGRLVELRDWLAAEKVTQVAMEATGIYWKPVWHVLEEGAFELLLVNPAHFKNLPGRKTDVKDSEWLAQLLECGLLRGSFIPPADIAKLRDLTRYRSKIIGERVRETQRVQKVLEDAGIKLDSVATDVLGKSCRAMIEALIAGERDPEVLAEMALTRMRPKIGVLREALVGRFDDHHALLLRMHLDHIDELQAMEARLDAEVVGLMAPFAEAATRLLSIPGVGKRVAEVIVAEIGVDMGRFPTDKHLASWVGLCPGHHESAGKRRSGRARKGNPALRAAMCEAAWAASHGKDTYLSAQFRRFKRRFGTKGETKAIFAVAHTMIVIVWHVLASDSTYDELGADFFERRTNTEARQRQLVRQLEALGHRVTLEPAA